MSGKGTKLQVTQYRPDIDGLRAIAVLLVVGFHAFPGTVPGGFIGVDVFFVISGFLISTLIFTNLDRSRFRLSDFYARRIKRIVPALVLVLGAALAAGWFLLLGGEYQQLGKHVLGGAAFVSNLLLLSEASYFDLAAELKPMLHLWSLGIEEQFYILWPLLVTLAWRRGWPVLGTTTAVALVSFAASVAIGNMSSPTSFYLPLTRFWELMLGSALAYIKMYRSTTIDRRPNMQSILGAAFLVAGVFFVSRDKTFPGWWALLPTIGTLLLVSAGPSAWLNRNVLANRISVWFGLISYPLYLWHWPALSISRMANGGMLDRHEKALIVVASVVMAWATYRLVEFPIRFGNSGKRVVGGLLTSLLIVGGAGYLTARSGGFPERAANSNQKNKANDLVAVVDQKAYAECPILSVDKRPHFAYCSLSRAGVADMAVFGDSHAQDKFYGLAKIDAKHNWLLLGSPSCAPVVGITVLGDVAGCEAKSEQALEWLIEEKNIKTVVLSFFGNYFLTTDMAADHVARRVGPSTVRILEGGVDSPDRAASFFYGVGRTIERLEGSGKRVILVIDVPELPFFPRDCLIRKASSLCEISREEVLGRQSEMRRWIGKLAREHQRLSVFDPIEFLCPSSKCQYETPEMLIYRDSHHLSLRGSELFAEHFLQWLTNARQ